MATRVYELAKELNMSNKDLITRLNNMGIETTSHMKALSDIDCTAVRNAVKRANMSNETKVVKVAQKETPSKPAAKKPATGASAKPSVKPAGASAKPAAKPTAGTAAKPAGTAAKSSVKPQAGAAAKPQAQSTQKAEQLRKRPESARPRAEKPEERRPRPQAATSADRGARPERTGRPERTTRPDAQGRRPGFAGQNRTDGGARSEGDRQSRSRDLSKKKGTQGRTGDFDQNRKGANDKRNGNRYSPIKMEKPQHSHKKDQRKEQRKEAARKAEEEAAAIPAGAIVVTVPITVKGLSEQIDVSTSQIIMTLMKMGIMANINQNLDEDVVQILGDELGKQILIGKVQEEEVEEGIENFEDREEDLKPRPPIITVMGHVDHGKTSLLDKIRNSSVTESESGGITQHIGASEIVHNGKRIVFLDTPGHEAFTAMRARGAYVTDIAVLVVAADDSVKPQTIEAISHAKAANVPIIVAINKIDKPGANIDMVKKDLADNGVLIEDWGGDVICVPVSAKTGEGIDNLLEMILLQAEVLELKANPSRLALGTVIEARLDKQRGVVATLLVLNGTLHAGMSIVAGNCSGRIKAMVNFRGEPMKKAGPATAVEILGLTDVPEAGDSFNAVSSDKVAREIAENRKTKQREEVMKKSASATLEDLFSQLGEGETKQLNLIIKADVQGSVGALVTSLEKLKVENAVVKIIHSGAGAINESDVMLASTTDAIIIGFNVRPTSAVAAKAQRDGVEIRTYSVIYQIIEEIEAALKGMLDPEFKEEVLGSAEVRDTFRVPNVGTIAGAYVLDGKVERNAGIRLVREGIVVHEGKIASLRRFKDDVKEVSHGFECGIGIENYNDIKEGDIIEAYKMVEVERK
jgi:translation initiation factor IF-2